MNKQYCALCGKKVLSDQKCIITVNAGSDIEEKNEVCLECMFAALGVSDDEQTKGTENE